MSTWYKKEYYNYNEIKRMFIYYSQINITVFVNNNNKIRMTTSMTSEAQKNMDGQRDKVIYQARKDKNNNRKSRNLYILIYNCQRDSLMERVLDALW